jgi:Tol biopolymer transport system component
MKPTKLILLTGLLYAALFAGSPANQTKDNKAEVALQAAIKTETVDGNLKGAIEQYQKIAALPGAGRATVATALLRMGQCYEKLGAAQVKEARATYERIVREFGDQAEPTRVARERLRALTAGGGGATGRTEAAMRRVWVGKDWPVGISPDGRYVVLILPGASRGYDYWLRDLQSGEQRPITREAFSSLTEPALISPDGKWIAYLCVVGSCGEIRMSALDGSSMRVLIPCQKLPGAMVLRAWMPDSRGLLAISFDVKDGGYGSYQRHIISVPDGAVREIGQPVRDPGPPTGSFRYVGFGIYPAPDGRHIAYSLKRDIYIYDTATEQDSVLVQSPAADYLTGWTPDGSAIVFLSDRSGTNDLYLLGIENGRPRGDPQLLRQDFGANTNLSLTRDGRLFRLENTPTTNSFIVPVDEQTGKLTGSPSPVDANFPGVFTPNWSPDGKLLYYEIFKQQAVDQSRLLFIRSEATGETREVILKSKLSYMWNPILSPDGRRFAVIGMGENKNVGFFAIDSESGDVSQLIELPIWWLLNIDWDPCGNWSPDGKAIFYKIPPRELDEKKPNLTEFIKQSKDFIILRKDLATGEEKDVHHGIPTADMQISPDGTRFVYYRRDIQAKSNVLGILDLQSDKELELWRVPQANSPGIGSPTWTPDGKYVLVGKNLKQGSELWRFPAAGGPGEKLHSFPESTWRFVVHPRGKRMAYTQMLTNFEVWVLENFLPAPKVVK